MKYLQNIPWLSDLTPQYFFVLLISLLIIIIITIAALRAGKKNLDIKK
jgi:hypothetical protein|tara:strand:+ start:331 stop:474 length:144 start_codon:yes stop_codon:yes gene_type:complete